MRLSKLVISGFKSFAKTTTLEFPAAVSAIVGPNGSGKSNVAEAIRWVLGEQSLKTLRGKKGEDLIFNGSTSAPRMGKAAVALTFDNRDRAIPLDFGEVILERKIFRDGTNEYFLNGSQVRLKDIVELIARMGLGETKHNIIGQGEVDRILIASPRERREMLEETIGLRIYQLKKREAERKLEETVKNVEQVGSLLKEIRPHLKFLKTQADKAEKHEVVRRELGDYFRALIARESKAAALEITALEKESNPNTLRLKTLEKEIAEISREVETPGENAAGAETVKAKESELAELESKRRDLLRELGRIEGRLEAEVKPAPDEPKKAKRHIEAAAFESLANSILGIIRRAMNLADIAEMKKQLENAVLRIEAALREINTAPVPPALKTDEGGRAAELEKRQKTLQEELAELESALLAIKKGLAEEMEKTRKIQSGLRERWQKLREREEEAAAIRSNLQRLSFEKEKLAFRREELKRVIEESGISEAGAQEAGSPFAALGTEELKRKIEKLKIRLEEIGGIDEAVLKEYNDTKTRYEFLERELGDLEKAAKDLRGLAKELEDRIESDFKKGFAKIKGEFLNYFRIIFGGGKGEITYAPINPHTFPRGTKPRRSILEGVGVKKAPAAGESMGENESEAETEYGIEIDVDLPQKRIKGLAMLSGGERALVSIALLFAITAVNPPPFLVLDETDAALDEANSQKYGAILKELSKKTQLILITHNRETMKQSGVLYGVTMGGDGISKILSLRLEEAESYGNR